MSPSPLHLGNLVGWAGSVDWVMIIGMNTVVAPPPPPPGYAECTICGSLVKKGNLPRHQRSVYCKTQKMIHELKKQGLVRVDMHTARMLEDSGVPMHLKRHSTRYMNNGHCIATYYQYWVTKAEKRIAFFVRMRCHTINRKRAKVVRDLLDNATAKVSIELGADPKPFIQEACTRLKVPYCQLSTEGDLMDTILMREDQ
jgi:hypothetical protein